MAIEKLVRAFEERAEIIAKVSMGALWDQILGEALDEWERLDRQFPPGTRNRTQQIEQRIEAFLEDLSDRLVTRQARQGAGAAYNEGRRAAIDSAAQEGRAQFVVRSEILDSNTCEVCQQLDGSVFEIGTPDYFRFFPPAGCLGGDQCRGFYVPVAEALL